MMRTLIIDDELHCREYLASLITGYCPDLNIVGSVKSVLEGLDKFAEYQPELVFLDIQMPGENGFDFLDHPLIHKSNPAIIFTTAYDHYAITAFRYSATDYLLKPVNIKELLEAVKKAQNRFRKTDYALISEIFDRLNTHRPVRKLSLPVSEGYNMVEISSILYFEAQGSYARVYFTDQKPMLVCKPVSFYEEILHSDQFFRVHRSFLVNMDQIISYNSDEDYLVLKDKSTIAVSKRKKSHLLQLIKDLIK
jgi:two-component system LytT family response regulator